jgi:hypothetical protein
VSARIRTGSRFKRFRKKFWRAPKLNTTDIDYVIYYADYLCVLLEGGDINHRPALMIRYRLYSI